MTTSRPTILFLVTEDWYFASHRLELAKALVEKGWRVLVATRVQKHGALLEGVGCELRPLAWHRSGNTPWSHLRAFVEIFSLLRRERPDIVHLVALKPLVFGSTAARLLGVPARVNAVAGLGFAFSSNTPRARFLRAILFPALRFALGGRRQTTIVQNRADRELLISARLVAESRIRLVRGAGVDLARYAAPRSPSTPPVVVLVARLLWDKGVGRFVTAAKALRARGVSARFVLVGTPDPDNPGSVPLAQLEAWRAERIVEWWGHRDDIPQILASASVYCLPTEYGEGIPKSLLEAAAAGNAIVATDMPGCREVIEHEVNGLLVPPGDIPALSDALQRVIGDPPLRDRLGTAARATIRDGFTLEQVIAEHFVIYAELRDPAAAVSS